METQDKARMIEVIETTLTRRFSGDGVEQSVRTITQYWDKDGNLLAENDPALAALERGADNQLQEADEQLAHCNAAIANLTRQVDSLKQANAILIDGKLKLVLEHTRLAGAIRWALGENGEFKSRPKNRGQYWWRTELRKRAGMKGLDEK